MDLRSRALAALNAAISECTDAARAALNAGRFDDASWCAGLANQLSKLSPGEPPSNAEHSEYSSSNSNGGESRTEEAGAKLRQISNRRRKANGVVQNAPQKQHISEIRGYPLFYKDRDILVKIGWSKSQGGEYEHRAPKAAVDSLAGELMRVATGKPTSMEALLPLRDSRGSELPSYQAYLALAWLRGGGAIQRHGQDGYSLTPEFSDSEAIAKLWSRLSTERPDPKS